MTITPTTTTTTTLTTTTTTILTTITTTKTTTTTTTTTTTLTTITTLTTTTTTKTKTVTTTILTTKISCDASWIPFNNHCYLFNLNELSWTVAEAFCRSKNGYLLKIDDQNEFTFVNNYNAANLGLNCFWVDETFLKQYFFKNYF
jgi:hypothetical protein